MSKSKILIVEDDMALREALEDTLDMAGYEVQVASDGREALEVLDTITVSMVVSDVQMSRMDGHALLKNIKNRWPDLPVLLMTAYGTIQKAVDSMRDGAVDYLVKPFEAEVLVNTVSRFITPEMVEQDMVAVDPRTQEVVEIAKRVAESDATVLITGESGSGKEVLARFLHNNSSRVKQPFIAINCAAIPDNMLEATLFGYEKGAFTGAYKACPGKFEQAQGGTILLDEISEMDLGLQAKLLRVLQEREVERLGSDKVVALDVRVLATSNRDMKLEVANNRFREDLYYRLNVFPIHLPPLLERPADIVPIAERILAKHASSNGKPIPVLSEEAKVKLGQHSWPGNVRELDNVMQRAMILQSGDEISDIDLQFELIPSSFSNATAVAPTESSPDVASSAPIAQGSEELKLGDDLKSHEQGLILETLSTTMGSRKLTAEKLGISQRTLRYKLAKMRENGIAIPDGK